MANPGSMLQFFKERGGPDSPHGNYLSWPGGVDGFPFLGPAAPDLKQEEFEDQGVQVQYHSKMFELWNPDHKKEFDRINNCITAGWYIKLVRHDQWDPEHKHFRVWLEWGQCYNVQTGKTYDGD